MIIANFLDSAVCNFDYFRSDSLDCFSALRPGAEKQ